MCSCMNTYNCNCIVNAIYRSYSNKEYDEQLHESKQKLKEATFFLTGQYNLVKEKEEVCLCLYYCVLFLYLSF